MNNKTVTKLIAIAALIGVFSAITPAIAQGGQPTPPGGQGGQPPQGGQPTPPPKR